jgi:hypothetical protein
MMSIIFNRKTPNYNQDISICLFLKTLRVLLEFNNFTSQESVAFILYMNTSISYRNQTKNYRISNTEFKYNKYYIASQV